MGGQPSGLLCFENKLGMCAAGQVGQLQMQQSATLIGDSPAAKLSVRLKDLQLFSHYLFVDSKKIASWPKSNQTFGCQTMRSLSWHTDNALLYRLVRALLAQHCALNNCSYFPSLFLSLSLSLCFGVKTKISLAKQITNKIAR